MVWSRGILPQWEERWWPARRGRERRSWTCSWCSRPCRPPENHDDDDNDDDEKDDDDGGEDDANDDASHLPKGILDHCGDILDGLEPFFQRHLLLLVLWLLSSMLLLIFFQGRACLLGGLLYVGVHHVLLQEDQQEAHRHHVRLKVPGDGHEHHKGDHRPRILYEMKFLKQKCNCTWLGFPILGKTWWTGQTQQC